MQAIEEFVLEGLAPPSERETIGLLMWHPGYALWANWRQLYDFAWKTV